jgi:hypothetical protein
MYLPEYVFCTMAWNWIVYILFIKSGYIAWDKSAELVVIPTSVCQSEIKIQKAPRYFYFTRITRITRIHMCASEKSNKMKRWMRENPRKRKS